MVNSKTIDGNSVKTALKDKFSAVDLDVGFLKTPGRSNSGCLKKTLAVFADDAEIVAAFAYALSRFTGRSDAVFCSVKNGIYYPHCVDCKNANVKKYVSAVKKELRSTYGLTFKNDKMPKEYFSLKEVVVSSEKITGSKNASIAFSYERSKDCMKIKLDYSEKIGMNMAERFVKTFEKILNGFKKNETLGEIDYSIPEDLVFFENAYGDRHKLKFETVIEAFGKAVEQYPDKNCVQHKNKRFTFKETDEITDGIASALSENGIKKGDRVAFVVSRSEWYIFCFYGIMKTGAAVVPIDEKNPDERISFTLSNAECKAVIVSPETEERIKNMGFDGKIINIARCKKKPFKKVKISGDDIAAIYYTSGSTGNPKGVLLPHVALENDAEVPLNIPEFTKDQVKGMLASIGFIMNIVFIVSVATMTTAVDVVPRECLADMKVLDEYFRKNKITDTLMTPRLAKAYFETVEDNPLYLVGFGGDSMCDIKPMKGKRLFVGYGMTECASCNTVTLLEDMMDLSCVGKPAQNTDMYILDAESRRVPYGGIGELCVSGLSVAKGYVGDSKLNEKFIKNPFSNEKYFDNLFRTGDFFRFLPDGSLGFVGRRDGIVKVRGNRVEIGEVNSAIKSIPTVKDVAVLPVKNKNGETELCAYIVSEGKIDQSFVESQILKSKPAYMVPAFVIKVDRIPFNINGKIDAKSLPKPNLSLLHSKYVAPRNEAEKALCDIFSEVLKVEKVGIDDDFVKLGGNSLNAVKVSSMFNSISDKMHITTLDILRDHTPRTIAENCKAISTEKIELNFDMEIPLTLSQSNMHTIVSRKESGESNMAYLISYEDWTPDKAHEVLLKVIEAHPVLKSRFVEKNKTVLNVFDTMPEIEFYKEEPHELSKRVIRHYNPGDVLSRFAITEWKGKTYLIADISHQIFDGRSILPFIGSIVKASEGVPLPLDDGILRQYAYETAFQKTDKYKKQCEKTISILKNADLNRSIPVVSGDRTKFDFVDILLNIVPADLDATAAAFNTTVGFLAASMFGYTLGGFSKKKNVYFHFSQDGRDNVDLEDSVGLFVRSNPIILPYAGEKENVFVMNNLPLLYELMSNAPLPLCQLEEKFGVWPNILFEYQHFSKNFTLDKKIKLEELHLGPYFNLAFILISTKKGYEVFCSHSGEHSHKDIEKLVDEFAKNLKNLVGETVNKGP